LTKAALYRAVSNNLSATAGVSSPARNADQQSRCATSASATASRNTSAIGRGSVLASSASVSRT